MSITVTTAADALAAITDHPATFLEVQKKKDEKIYKGSKFFNAKYLVKGMKRDGWFSARNIQLGKGIADPDDKSNKNTEFEGMRLQLTSTVSRAGVAGEFLLKLNEQWPKTIRPLTEGQPPTIDMDGCRLHEIVQTKTGKSSKTPGLPIDDPVIRWKLDFSKYPDTYPIKMLRGTQKTIILDASKPIEGKTGPFDFHPAIVEVDGNEVPLNDANVHLFVNDYCIAQEIRWSMPSAAQSQAWVSLPMYVSKVVIVRGPDSGFSDEIANGADSDVNSELAAKLSSDATATATAAATTTDENAATATAIADNIVPPEQEPIADFLGEL